MRRLDILALLVTLSIAMLTGCAPNSFDAAYSIVDTGTPIDMESDF